eukprot:TRINITY_DN1014_c0_g1_i1.p1 TRINITY_DN1014_c0_g1~~TRINITY_DN1014_c0_g1_i1.p1  ORF type:complete len:203 (-),score=59.66 TRINITY_DN1014_c0_g1_i1:49-657(-)
MTNYDAILDPVEQKVRALLKETEGWTLFSETDGIITSSKPLEGCSVNCFRGVGFVKTTPKKALDLVLSFGLKEWQALDAAQLSWEVIEQVNDHERVVYQVNKLPWPLWSRDTVTVSRWTEDADGSWIFVHTSVDHPKKPEDTQNYVRAKVVLSAYLFEAAEGGTRMHRIAQIDPAGNIPSAVVNMQAGKVAQIISHTRSILE